MYNNSLEGRVYLNATPTAGATGTGEQTLMSYSLPANSLYKPGQSLRITAGFKNNSSDTVSWKLYFASESVTVSCTTTTSGTANIEVFNLGSLTPSYSSSNGSPGTLTATSNSQTVVARGVSAGTTNVAAAFTAATEDPSTALLIKLTETATSSGANATAEFLSVEFIQAP